MSNNKRVLIVDNADNVRKEISEILEMENFLVSSATNGFEGLIKTKNNKPDLIVSDVMMPILNGYQFIQRIKRNPDTENIPVIFLSTKVSNEDIRIGMNLGAVEYLTKPVLAKDLLFAINRNIDRAKVINENSYENLFYTVDSFSTDSKVRKTKFADLKTNSLIEKIVTKEAKAFNRHTDIEFSLQPCKIKHNRFYFKKIVKNMIQHTLLFSTKGSKVKVISRCENNYFKITVENLGFQVDIVKKSVKDCNKIQSTPMGCTIGLSIIESIARLCNNKFSINSKNGNILSISVSFNL